jgi:SAM-dependent methyltransferase
MNPDQVRERVRETYTAAVVHPKSSCCGSPEVAKGILVHEAGYDPAQLEALPADAVENSFGCGDPLAFAGVQSGQTVVDLGSGAGIDCLLAARAVGPKGRVIGIDMTPAMLERARQNARRAGHDNIEFRSGLIEQLPVESASADWVISNCVINLSPQKRLVFNEINRVLKPGGKVLVSDIVAERLPWTVRQIASLWDSCVAGAISETEYLDQMRQAGLEEARVVARHTYDAAQLAGLAEGCCAKIPGWAKPLVKRLVSQLAGHVHSVRVAARKRGQVI